MSRKLSVGEKALIYDLQNGDDKTMDQMVRFNSRGVAKVLQDTFLLSIRMDWHERLLFGMLAMNMVTIGIVAAS